MKKVALAMLGGGALLLVLGIIIWAVNKPNFYAGIPSEQASTTADAKDFRNMLLRRAAEADAAYSGCLFSSANVVCQGATAVPFLTYGGILLMLAGGCVFVASRRQALSA